MSYAQQLPQYNSQPLNGQTSDEITATELHAMRQRGEDIQLIDVRDPEEYDLAHIDGATLIPLAELPNRFHELDRNRPVVLHCRRGIRSMKALKLLQAEGFTRVKSVCGGIEAWSTEVDPSVPRY